MGTKWKIYMETCMLSRLKFNKAQSMHVIFFHLVPPSPQRVLINTCRSKCGVTFEQITKVLLTFDLILVQERPAAEGRSPCEARPLLVGVEGAQAELTLAEDGYMCHGGTKGYM